MNFKLHLLIAASCLMGLAAVNLLAQATEPRRFAILVGINKYADQTILQLQKAQKDAEDFAGVLDSGGSFRSVKLMSSGLDYADPLFPSKDNIVSQVEQLTGILRPSDQVLFFFSGHGLNDAETGDSYLLTIDTKAKNFTGTALNLQKDVLAKFESAGVGNVVALVDACQKTVSNDKGLSVVGVDWVKPTAKAVVITATGPGKASYEDPKGSNGLFTKGLLAAFTGAADKDKNGEISVAELEGFLPDTVSEYAYNASLNQNPTVYDADATAPRPSLGRVGKVLVKAAVPAGGVATVQAAQAVESQKPFATFTNSVGMTMVAVPGGTFTMGDTVGKNKNETKHEVTLSDFIIGQTEVTQVQYQKVMGKNPSKFKGDNLPVEQVSWYDAVTFCNTLSQLEGLHAAYTINGNTVMTTNGANGYRLPTEAEWEYAAKGGKQNPVQTMKFSGGDNENEMGWTQYNSGHTTHPVAQKKANQLGLFDMTGNVGEWCQDWYGSYSTISQSNPSGPSTGKYRVYRGGSWFRGADELRTAFHDGVNPEGWYNNIGFRVVLPSR